MIGARAIRVESTSDTERAKPTDGNRVSERATEPDSAKADERTSQTDRNWNGENPMNDHEEIHGSWLALLAVAAIGLAIWGLALVGALALAGLLS